MISDQYSPTLDLTLSPGDPESGVTYSIKTLEPLLVNWRDLDQGVGTVLVNWMY